MTAVSRADQFFPAQRIPQSTLHVPHLCRLKPPILSVKSCLEIVRKLSQFTTHGFLNPSLAPSGTSIGIFRMVVAISAATNLFRKV
jgi:hypothetical protein